MKQIPIISRTHRTTNSWKMTFWEKMNTKYASNKESWHVSNVIHFSSPCVRVCICIIFVSFGLVWFVQWLSIRIAFMQLLWNRMALSKRSETKQNKGKINETKRKPTRTILLYQYCLLQFIPLFALIDFQIYSSTFPYPPTLLYAHSFFCSFSLSLSLSFNMVKKMREKIPTNIWWNTQHKRINIGRKSERAEATNNK